MSEKPKGCAYIDRSYEFSTVNTPSGPVVRSKPCCYAHWNKIPSDIRYRKNLPVYSGTERLSDHPVIEWFRSHDTANGEYPSACDPCIKKEALGAESPRQQAYDDVDNLNPDGLYTIDIMVGNECNLACAMCNIYSSNLIQKESAKHADTPNIWRAPEEWENLSMDSDASFAQLDQLMDRHSVGLVKFKGGEPLLKRNWENLKRGLDAGKYANTNVKITTNGVNLTARVLDTLSQAKHCRIIVSFDGVGPVCDFVRWPNTWEKFQKTLDVVRNNSHDNITINSSTIINMLNICDVANIYREAKAAGFYKIHFDDDLKPEGHVLDYRNLCPDVRKDIKNNLPMDILQHGTPFKYIIDSEHRGWSDSKEIKRTLAWFEKHRKQSLDTVFPPSVYNWYTNL